MRGRRREGSGPALSPGLPGKWPPFLSHCQLELGTHARPCTGSSYQRLGRGLGNAALQPGRYGGNRPCVPVTLI